MWHYFTNRTIGRPAGRKEVMSAIRARGRESGVPVFDIMRVIRRRTKMGAQDAFQKPFVPGEIFETESAPRLMVLERQRRAAETKGTGRVGVVGRKEVYCRRTALPIVMHRTMLMELVLTRCRAQ